MPGGTGSGDSVPRPNARLATKARCWCNLHIGVDGRVSPVDMGRSGGGDAAAREVAAA